MRVLTHLRSSHRLPSIPTRRHSTTFTRRQSDAWPISDLLQLPPHLRPQQTETLDLILRQSIYLIQSRRGYRANTDAHILAYFAWKLSKPHQTKPLNVLDLGSGVGLVSLLFSRAHPPASLHLVEFQPSLVSRAFRNVQLNHIPNAQVLLHDISQPLPPLPPSDLILINPPFYTHNPSRIPPTHEERRLAHLETSASLLQFLSVAQKALNNTNPHAFIAMIHDPREMHRIKHAVANAGLVVAQLREMAHCPGEQCTRILLQLKLQGEENNVCLPSMQPSMEPLFLHPSKYIYDRYTEEIEHFLDSLPVPTLKIGRLKGC